MAESGWEAFLEDWDSLEGPPGGLGVVRRPSSKAGSGREPSRRAGSGREALLGSR